MAYQYDIPFFVDLSGRVALVTGGNGGIGSMFCRALAACGATVIVLGRKMATCQAVVDEINQGGGDAIAMTADATSEESMTHVRDEIQAKYGKLNILINAAGGAMKSATCQQDQYADGGEQDFFSIPAVEIARDHDLNFTPTWLPSKIMAPLMMGQDGANIINISSMSAITPLTRIPGYSSGKAGVSSFTQWMATYMAKSGVRVNAIAPGFFATAQNHDLQYFPDGTPRPRLEKIIKGTPMGRQGDLRELIGAMLFLVSEKSAGFVTGIVLPVDGGFSAYSGV